ncbi:MAG: TraX family protein [Lachnospiraceae bacterium]|nr:TraX family protein [Lachnospiraceae bacterium]
MTNQITTTDISQPSSGFPANFLKIFAALTMLIDHAAVTLVYARLAKFPEYLTLIFSADATAEELAAIPADYLTIYSMYSIMRLVGRIAFPIFAFLVFEGFLHTSDYKKYLLRVGLCALAAELPFNLIISTVAPIYGQTDGTASLFYPQHQNTVFTLFLALLMLYAMKRFETTEVLPKAAFKQWFGQILCVLAACVIAVLTRVDYSYIGILYVAVLYFFRNSKKLQILFGCIIFLSVNIASLLAFVPIAMYNGTLIRSKKFKYFFYIFYPVHLLVLYLISLFL